ncbi:protein of unknown function [Sterolibacterium denitrificans]|uniref:Uncharacterized protein n=1 Tax=Sterolibacterium denitrificans TaxID=157592 RepID=A0A7Z7HSN2_9PROT|nr:protein of unknown function [Sterolibacterium denitrificans]
MSSLRAKVEKRAAAAEALTFAGWSERYFKHKADPKSGAEQRAAARLIEGENGTHDLIWSRSKPQAA